MLPGTRDQQLQLHRAATGVAADPLGVPHQLPADAGAAMAGRDGEHAELAHVAVQPPDPHATQKLSAMSGHGAELAWAYSHGEFTGPHDVGDLRGVRPGGAGGPQAVLGRRVHFVDQIGQRGHQRGILGRRRRQQLDVEPDPCAVRNTDV